MPINPNNLAATATMTFDDEFATMPLSLWNGTTGTWRTTYDFADPNGNGSTLAGNSEQEWYINNNYAPTSSVVPWYISNGVLNLVANPAPTNIQPLINNYQYTSGLLTTQNSFSQTYGYFEMRAKLPAGQGLWPAFWLLNENGAWPPEIDAMEVLGNNPSALFTTSHYVDGSGNNTQQSWNTTVPNTSTSFNTYGVDWEPDYITWYFDGQAVFRTPTPADNNSPMYMLLDLAVGGSFPGDVNSSTPFPADMQVQWVRAYQALPNAPVETSPSTAAAATGSGTVIAAAGASVALAGAATETTAAMLSDGEIALAGAVSGGSGVGALFTSAGALVGSTFTLQTWDGNGLDPQITPLVGGMWQVTYAEPGAPNAVEVYNASGTLVFLNNVFVAGSPVFAALTTGGYVETRTTWAPNFLLVDASGKINWIALPTSTAGAVLQPSAIQSLGDGGFVFSYAGSTELDRYNFSGGVHTTIQLASAPTNTPVVVGFSDLVTEAAWVNSSGALEMQGFGPSGTAMGAALTAASSVDAGALPQLLATGVSDNSVLLWSAGGTTYGAAYNGVTASSAVALAPVAFSGVTDTLLTNGELALSWVETDNGVQNAWVEVLNPTTMTVSAKQELGAATGGIHVIALAGGGFAESWRTSGGVEAVANDGLGHYGSEIAVSGDFLGLNGAGQVVAVAINGGQATLQAYSLSTPPPPASVAITSTGGLTNKTAQTVTGTGPAGTTVTLYTGASATGAFATAVGSATVGANGTWSIPVTLSGQGAHYFEAKDQGAVSGVVGYTLDTIAPAVSVALVADTGVSSTDKITSNPAVTGSGDPNAVVHFTVDGTAVSASATANASGTWSFTPTGLADGSHTITATETDAAGNVGTASLSFTLDTHAAVAGITTFTETSVRGGYNLALGGTASDLTAVESVRIYEDGTQIGSVQPGSSGAWSFTATKVTNADHVFTIATTDAAGNVGAGTGELVLGTSGADTLTGGPGNDIIYGGGGADTLTGGGGADTFVYRAVSDAPVPRSTSGPYETITDFNPAMDHIDLSALGQLTYGGQTKALTSHHVDWYVSGANTFVIVNDSHGSHVDMIIELHGAPTLSSADFILA